MPEENFDLPDRPLVKSTPKSRLLDIVPCPLSLEYTGVNVLPEDKIQSGNLRCAQASVPSPAAAAALGDPSPLRLAPRGQRLVACACVRLRQCVCGAAGSRHQQEGWIFPPRAI